MIDIVIPLRNDSTWNNNEIRYCLRSVEKHLTGIRDVYIIGHKPKFLQNVVHIPMRDPSPYVTVNIKNKVLRACEEKGLSDDFLFMNDDHYLMPKFNIRCLYYSKTLKHAVSSTKNSIYRLILNNTIMFTGHDQLFYDVHTPTVFNKAAFKSIMERPAWDIQFGIVMKTWYWFNHIPDGDMPVHTEISDGKIRSPKADWADIAYHSQFTPVISSSDRVGPGMVKFLERMFPEKSKYEI
jgi:hypothetical protein